MNIQFNVYRISSFEVRVVKTLVTVIFKVHYLQKVELRTDLPFHLHHHFQIDVCILDHVFIVLRLSTMTFIHDVTILV